MKAEEESKLGRDHEIVLHIQKFLPSRGQTPTMHIWEKGKGGQLIWMVGETVQKSLYLIKLY